ncbi:MAG: hypothetical protein PHY92_06905 [Alphaproteobacteria bacterium]|nr:hypothetical protein [Alphaproteobacteria bacterium]
MDLININKSRSFERADFTRLSADVVFERSKETRTYWIEFPSEYHDEISTDGNCWLILLNALAAINGEDITIRQPVDPYLLENIKSLRREWHAWNKSWKITNFNCPNLVSLERTGRNTGMFFSGGIDSFYSLLRNNKEPNDEGDATGCVTDLITVWGFEINLTMAGEFARLKRHIENVAEVFQKNHIVAITNIRSFDDDFAKLWIPVGHSGTLGFVGYALQGRFREIVIGSTMPYGMLKPYGSHALTDTLMSSKALRVFHDGAIAKRTQKTERVAFSGEALKIIHVCLRKDEGKDGTSSYLNCSACEKCVLTMAALDLSGKKGKAASFDWSNYSAAALGEQLIRRGPLYHLWHELHEAAKAQNRPDIAAAIAKAIRKSRPFWILSDAEDWMKRNYSFVTKNKKTLQKIKRAFYAAFHMRA